MFARSSNSTQEAGGKSNWEMAEVLANDKQKEKESESEVSQSVRFFATPWTVARQAPPSMGFPRQEYWSGLPFPFQGH